MFLNLLDPSLMAFQNIKMSLYTVNKHAKIYLILYARHPWKFHDHQNSNVVHTTTMYISVARDIVSIENVVS